MWRMRNAAYTSRVTAAFSAYKPVACVPAGRMSCPVLRPGSGAVRVVQGPSLQCTEPDR